MASGSRKMARHLAWLPVLALLLIACGGTAVEAPATAAPEPEPVTVFLVAVGDAGQNGPRIGCDDSVVPVEQTAVAGESPVATALNTLLALPQRPAEDPDLYSALAQSSFTVEEVQVEDGHAEIYLEGQLRLAGVCDEPRVVAQLQHTTLQFDAIDSVDLYLNGQPLEEQLR
jgi:spore germination protein GerM